MHASSHGRYETLRLAARSGALFALNAAVVWPLFFVEFLDVRGSNEGSFITFAAFLQRHWPDVGWFPWFNAGLPFENTYPALVSGLTALLASASGWSVARAFHVLAALALCAGPVFLFLFARGVSGRTGPSFAAALGWSLLSPSAVFPDLLADLGGPWGPRRLYNVVMYGETPHNVALALLPLFLWLLWRCLDHPNSRRFALAALTAAAILAANTFGMVILALGVAFLLAARPAVRRREVVLAVATLAVGYLAVCRILTPSLLRLTSVNAQQVGGDYRWTATDLLAGAALVGMLAMLSRLRLEPVTRFAMLACVCFGTIVALGFAGVTTLPQPVRYHLEFDFALCLLAPFALAPLLRWMPAQALAAAGVMVFGWFFVRDLDFSRAHIRPLAMEGAPIFQQAKWLEQNLPGQRVMVPTEGLWLFNVFTDNPQVGAGHEPYAPNWMQRVAVYTIHSGANAGERDGEISTLWLKAFGCGAVIVADRDSPDAFHAIANPGKFEGLLPRVWRDGGESIYRVLLASPGLVHAVPKQAVVGRAPVHGLDVEPLRAYVAALDAEDPGRAAAQWQHPGHAKIHARMQPEEVLSVQVSHDPGWEAWRDGVPVPVRADGLGLMVIEPGCTDECDIDLAFTGGAERTVTLWLSAAALAGLLGMLFVPWRYRGGRV